jgi:hypothetical protein
MTAFCFIHYYPPDDGHLLQKHIAIKYNLNIDIIFILYCCVDGNFIIIRDSSETSVRIYHSTRLHTSEDLACHCD